MNTEEVLLERSKLNLISNIYTNDSWGSLRHLVLPTAKPHTTDHALLNVATRGDLSSLTWYSCPHPRDVMGSEADGLITCDVHYAPLNFRDIMLASGKLPPDALPGNLATKVSVFQIMT